MGHTGGNFGYVSWAGCLPGSGSVIVVLSNREFEDIGGMPTPLVDAVISDDHPRPQMTLQRYIWSRVLAGVMP